MAETAERNVSGLEALADEREEGLLRLDDLRARVRDGDDGEALAAEALRELQETHEELQVSEEELRAQSQELAEAYRRLVRERQRYRDLFEHAPVGYLVTDHDGLIRDANGAAGRLLGRAPQYLRGKPFRLFVGPEERTEFSRWLTRLRDTDGAVVGELSLAPRDREPFPARCIVAPVRGTDGHDGLRWVVHPLAAEGDQLRPVTDLGVVRSTMGDRDGSTRHSMDVVVVDRQPLFVRNLDALLETLVPGRARLAGAVEDPDELDELLERTDPDLVVVTVTELDGQAHAASRTLNQREDLAVLVLAGRADGSGGDVMWSLVDEGFQAVLPRSAAPDAIVGAMLGVTGGWAVLDRSLSKVLLGPGRPLREDLRESLSDDHLELWRWIAAGRSDAAIAEDRNVSTRTIKRRVADLYTRLDVDNRVEAAALAGHYGLVDPQEIGAG